MTKPINQWHADHARFAKLLILLEEQVIAFHTDEHPDYALMVDIIDYLQHYPDRVHHPREDVAFKRLVEHEPGLQLQVARRLQEHRVIAKAGDDLRRLLQGVVDGVLIERAAVEVAAATYLAYYRHHLTAEEFEVIPHATKLLTDDDWAAVAAAVSDHADPLFGEHPEVRFRELRAQITRRTA